MAVVTSDFLAGLYRSLQALYKDTYEKTEADYQKIAMEVPSTTSENQYQWLGEVPGMKEWVDERTLEDLKAWDYTIKNKDWESTIAVDRNAIEDDQLGIIRPRVMSLAVAAKTHPDELVFSLLAQGFSQTCFDGQYFFDTDHPLADGSTQSNKITLALDATGLKTALATLRRLKGWTGRPLNLKATHLVVPPELEWTARELLRAERDASGATNILRGAIPNIIVSPYLADTNNWFVLDASKPVKPLIFQMRKRPEFVSMDDPKQSETVFMRKKYLYGVDARYNVGYGLYQLAVGSEVA